MSEPSVDRDPFEGVAESFLERYRAGEHPSITEYAARYPELAEQIRRLLPALVMVERDLSVDVDSAPPARDAIDRRSRCLGDYRILREIGRGGMGVVFEAEQVSLGRRVALKVLPHQISRDPESLERFRREAKAAARLHHTNIVPVFEVGQDGDTAYYAMQFIQGQGLDLIIEELGRVRDRTHPAVGGRAGAATTLSTEPTLGPMAQRIVTGRLVPDRDRAPALRDDTLTMTDPPLDEGPSPAPTLTLDPLSVSREPRTAAPASVTAVLPGGAEIATKALSGRRPPFFRSVAQIGLQAANGLAHAHARGIIHRDIKPSNLLLDHAGVIWIADFGLAKADDDGLTTTGSVLGTIRYMAPERFGGGGDARADIYALGVTLYELATLRPAYQSSDPLGLIERIKKEEPPRPRSLDARIPRDLETIILKAIEKDPARRYPMADAMAEDLRRFLNDETIQARQATPAERCARWARHHPAVAALGALLTVVLFLSTVASLVVAGRMSELARSEKLAASAERQARTAAVADAYRAMLSEARALRAGHEPGWRDEALATLAKLAEMRTARRDLVELRTEAAAALATPDIRPSARIAHPRPDLGSFTFTRDGRTLITASRGGGLEFWDVREGRHVSTASDVTVNDTPNDLDRVACLPDGRGLLVATADRGLLATDMRGRPTPAAPITLGASRPVRLAIDARGDRVAVAWTEGATITVHDVADGKLIARLPGSPVFALSPDGRWLAREEASEIVLLPIDPGGTRVVLGRHSDAYALAFSPDGSILAATFRDHTAILWDVARREPFSTLRGHRERIYDVAFSPDGDWIATVSLDYTTRIWDRRTGQNIATLSCANAVRRVAFSPAGDLLATSTDTARDVFLYAISGRRGVRRWLSGHREELRCVAADPRRDRIVTSGYTDLSEWDLTADPPASGTLPPHPGAVNAAEFSPDGSLLATASWLGTDYRDILIRDGDTGRVRGRIPGRQVVYALAFDPSGRRLAFGGNGGEVAIWDLAENRPIRSFSTGATTFSLAFLDEGRTLVAHDARSVFLVDVASGERVRSVELGHGDVRSILVDRTRSRLVVGLEDGSVAGLALPGLDTVVLLPNDHSGAVECLSQSSDGRLLATACANRRIAIREADSFRPLLHLPTWDGNIRDLTFTSDGRRLAIVGTDTDVHLWDIAELSRGLAAVGLSLEAPDRPPASVDGPAAGPIRSTIAVIRRPGSADPADVQRALSLQQVGIAAYQGGRSADAIRDLGTARDLLRGIYRADRENRQVASQFGICLLCLGGALRSEGRPAEAQASLMEARDVYESIRVPSHVDLYNLACVYGRLYQVGDPTTSSRDPAARETLAERAVEALRRSLATGMTDFALIDRDPDLDPLRRRPDFSALMLDRAFPRNPFSRR